MPAQVVGVDGVAAGVQSLGDVLVFGRILAVAVRQDDDAPNLPGRDPVQVARRTPSRAVSVFSIFGMGDLHRAIQSQVSRGISPAL
jgi:hypothetical protein